MGRAMVLRGSVMVWVGALLAALIVTSPAAAQRLLLKVALEGEEAPGTGGSSFSETNSDAFDEPFINTSCHSTFNACYSGGRGSGCGTFLWRGGALTDIVRSGQVLPGGVGAVTLNDIGDIDGPIFNNRDTVGLVIRANNGNTAAVVQKTLTGALAILVKAGGAVPGTTSGVFTDFDDMSQSNNDDFAFIGIYTEDQGTTFRSGVFLKPSGQPLEKVVLEGEPLPTGCGTFDPPSDFPDGPWMNDLLAVAFQIDAACGDGTVFLKRRGMPIEVLVKEGDSAPASIGGTIDGINPGRPGLNNSNTLGFRASISGGSVESALLTKTAGGALGICAQENVPAPGTTGTLDGFGGEAGINQDGSMFVQADVAGDPNVLQGIFVCRNVVVEAVALQGDPIPTTSSSFTSSVEEGSIGDGGQVVFMHENTPLGVFARCDLTTPAPMLSPWAILAVVALLSYLGASRLRRRHPAGVAVAPDGTRVYITK